MKIVQVLALALACQWLAGCSVMYFHNGEQSMAVSHLPLEHSKTYHDGFWNLVTDSSMALDETCVDGHWQTIKSENTMFDLVVRFIGNPIYGTSTVSFTCAQDRDDRLASADDTIMTGTAPN